MKLLIKNARIATSERVFLGDILTDGEIISQMGTELSAKDAQIIDAKGRYLLPGGVDVHTHFDIDAGLARSVDTFLSGTVAAACGGTTTIVDHPGFGFKGCRLFHQLDVYRELAKNAVVDYGFHGVIQHLDDHVFADMEALIAQGISSYKIYLTYGYKLEDDAVLQIFGRAAELGLVICVHCENDAIIHFLTQQFVADGKISPRYHAESRPDCCEAEAVWRMLMLAKAAGEASVYIVHLSSELGLDAIRLARSKGQKHVYAETCPQYLLLDKTCYEDEHEGVKYLMSPPLRAPADNVALWEGLKNGDIQTIGTDHCSFSFVEQKLKSNGNFTMCPNGIPGVEHRMGLLFSEGFMKERLSLPEVVRICCRQPAQLFGLYPRKGDIRLGADADFVLFDPDATTTVTHATLHSKCDYTPYESMKLSGAPVMTISRGEVIVENGVFIGKEGRGKYLKRDIPAR